MAAALNPNPEIREARTVACPDCKAEPGEPCRFPHQARGDSAAHGGRLVAFRRRRFIESLDETLIAAERYVRSLR